MALPETLNSLVTLTGSVPLADAPEPPAGLLPARQQMALSLGWHIVLACFGVAFPAIIFVTHLRGIRRDDKDALTLAKRWSKVSGVLFAIGAVSGTVLSFEMGILWPGLMGTYGDVLGLPFAFEGLAFFLEAIFLGIYLYGWGRMPPKIHLLMVVPMAITGVVGAYCVLAVNAWMNAPTGFRLVDGQVTDVNPWAALTNGHTFLQFLHMWIGAYMVVGLSIAGVYAVGLLRGRRNHYHRLGFTIPFVFATVATLIQPVAGHVLGSGLADRQPAKLAAMELAATTESPAALHLGGIYVDGEVKGAITVPVLGSVVARNSLDAPVRGLDTFAEEDLPPVNLTHWAFQVMVGLGTLLAAGATLFWLARWRGRDLLERRWFLRAMALAGPAAVVALQAGWITTEVGRQPWVVYGYLRTVDAAADYSSSLWLVFGASIVVYGAMTVGAVVVIRSMARRWRAGEEDLPSPYGPDVVAPDADASAAGRV